MRHNPLLTVLLVPDAAVRSQSRAVDRRPMPLVLPRVQQPYQLSPKAANQAGNVSGNACKRRSQVRRHGQRPFSVNSVRKWLATGSGWLKNASNAQAVYNRRTIITINALISSRSEYTRGRHSERCRLGGRGTRSIRHTRLTSRPLASTIFPPPRQFQSSY